MPGFELPGLGLEAPNNWLSWQDFVPPMDNAGESYVDINTLQKMNVLS